MKEEYYIPELEDLRIGYECEVNGAGLAGGQDNWVKDTAKSINNLKGLESFLKAGCLRTSYLTKEQIEVEGWIFDCERDELFAGRCLKFKKSTKGYLSYSLSKYLDGIY